ncbi:MAG: RNA polymerase sigma-70 factor (ECF subfamily) [Planctomycetaceae bacterium]|jgi:RNA polymerase sigma-70 factor (ECF subfamily)
MRNWDQIVAEHGPTAFRQIQRILGPGPDADDVAQEVFLELFRLWEERKVRNWSGLLSRIATNRAIDLLRRRRTLESLTAVDVPSSDDGPLETAIVGELAARLRIAIGQLPDRQAEVFSLRYFADQSHEQIAKTLEIDVRSVGTALHKARMKLNLLLEVNAKGAS